MMDSNLYTVTMLGLGGGSVLGIWLLFGFANDSTEVVTRRASDGKSY